MRVQQYAFYLLLHSILAKSSHAVCRARSATFALIVSFTRARRLACKIEMSALLKDVPWVPNAHNTYNAYRSSYACSLLLTSRKEVANCTEVYAHHCSGIINNMTATIGLELHSTACRRETT